MSGRFSESPRPPLATSAQDGLLSAADYSKLEQLGTDSGWIGVGNYGTNWAAHSADYAPYYRKVLGGLVILRGLVAKGAALTPPEVMFTLPAGYRPGGPATGERIFAVACLTGHAEVRVYANGSVQVVSGSANWMSLDGISFTAEN